MKRKILCFVIFDLLFYLICQNSRMIQLAGSLDFFKNSK